MLSPSYCLWKAEAKRLPPGQTAPGLEAGPEGHVQMPPLEACSGLVAHVRRASGVPAPCRPRGRQLEGPLGGEGWLHTIPSEPGGFPTAPGWARIQSRLHGAGPSGHELLSTSGLWGVREHVQEGLTGGEVLRRFGGCVHQGPPEPIGCIHKGRPESSSHTIRRPEIQPIGRQSYPELDRFEMGELGTRRVLSWCAPFVVMFKLGRVGVTASGPPPFPAETRGHA